MQLLVMGTEKASDTLQGWSLTTVGGFCSSPPRQPQLRTLLGRGTLIIIIIVTHNIAFPCLHLFFFCNFNESFKSRSRFSLRHVLGASSLPFSHASPLHAMQVNVVPVFLGERLNGGVVCSRNVDSETFSLLLATGLPSLLGWAKGCVALPKPHLC